MKEYSVIMSLVDYIPVVLYLIAAIVLQRALYPRMSKGAFALFAAGTIDVFCAGALKATYKLLYALGICDFAPLSDMFFPVQSIGFLLAGIAMIALISHKQGKGTTALAVAAPVLWKGTALFVAMMIAGAGMMDAGIIVLAKRHKKRAIIVLMVISFAFLLGMGYLSSRDFAAASMNWIAEGVNIVAMGTLLVSSLMLSRALREE